MNIINLPLLIEQYDLRTRDIAEHLFPGNKYSKLALDRILNGTTLLNSEQISRLSQFTGIAIENLFSNSRWEIYSNEKHEVKFNSGDYEAILDTEKMTSKIFHKKHIFHTEVIHARNIQLSEFIAHVESVILEKSKTQTQI